MSHSSSSVGPAVTEVPVPTGRRLLLALGVWLVLGGAGFGVVILTLRTAGHVWDRAHRADAVGALLLWTYLALLFGLMAAFGGPTAMWRRLRFRFTTAKDLGLAVAVWVGCLFAGAVLTAVLTPLLGPPQSNAASLLSTSFDPLFVVLVVPTVCLLAPVCEELLFRGALYGWLRRRLPAIATIPVVAALFAGVHLLPTLLPTLFVFGLGAAWVRERTGSTLNSFAMHASQNTLAVVVTYILLTR